MESEENNIEKTVRENKVAYAGQLLSVLIQVVVYCLLLAKLGDILHVATQTRLRYLFVWESIWLIDVVMALYVVCVIAAIVHIVRRNCHIGCGYWLFGGFLTSVWAYVRFFPAKIPSTDTGDVYSFTNMEWFPSLTWADVFVGGLWIMLVAYIVRNLKDRKTQASETKKEVIKDNPIERKDEDKLDYARWAKIMCQEICDMENDKAYSYGVVGEWGIGKTSYINLLKRELEETKKPIEIIDFNPRNSSRASRIQEDFLMTLCRSLKKYDLGLSLLTSRYVKALRLDSRIDIIASLLNIFHSGNVWRLRERISESVRRIGRKVVVFIDDLDRMGREEIIEVFKLIDCNASFPNTIFVTAYNKAQVNKILSSYQGEAINDDEVNYSDKYFHRELRLIVNPPYVMSMFVGFISRDLKLKQIFHANSSHDLPLPLIATNFSNVRELKKFVNQLAEIDIERWREVDEAQFIMLQIVRYVYHSEYCKIMRMNGLSLLPEQNDTIYNIPKFYYREIEKVRPMGLQVIIKELFDKEKVKDYNYSYKCIASQSSFTNYFVESKDFFKWSTLETLFALDTPFEEKVEPVIKKAAQDEDKLYAIIVYRIHIDEKRLRTSNKSDVGINQYMRDIQILFCSYETTKNSKKINARYKKVLDFLISDEGRLQLIEARDALHGYQGTFSSEAMSYLEKYPLSIETKTRLELIYERKIF